MMTGSPWCAAAGLCLAVAMAILVVGVTGGSAWAGATVLGLGLLLAILIGLVLGLIASNLGPSGGPEAERRPRSPQQTLEERFAQGKLTRQAYRAALVDILKGRYVRGELDLDEYQAQLDLLLDESARGSRPESGEGTAATARH